MAARLTLKDPYTEVRVFNARMFVSALVVLVLFGVLVYRYFDLQIHQYEKYRTESDRNRVQLQPIPPKRGLIFDRNGVVLADNAPSYSLTIIKEIAGNLDQRLELLRSLLDIDGDDIAKFKERLKDRRPYQQVPLRFRLTEEEIAILAINRYRLPGVEVEAEFVRSYPHGPLFAHALGYVGRISEKELKSLDPVNYSGTHYMGKIGVERFYEAQLHGQVGNQNVETNARGRVLRVLERNEPMPGKNIKLYLDAKLQQVAQEALGEHLGSVVAIDPRNGGVLALVSTPDFDANLFVTGISGKNYRELRDSPDMPLFNRALQGAYPPGSTVKPIFALAGLVNGIVTPSTRIADPGWYQLPNDSRFYRDWRRGGHGSVDLKQAIAQSCDVYFYDLAHKLNIDRLHDFAVQFGFGATTGIDNTHENSGIMPSREWKRRARKMTWFPGETLSAGIGQGYMTATPLQLAVATATVASRGVRYEPRMVQSIDDQPLPAGVVRTVKVPDTYWDEIIAGMVEVVHGERGTAKVMGRNLAYHMAGKTGTAQVVGYAQGIKYDASQVAKRRRDHALFVGFAPVEDPQIAIAVLVENGEHGASTAAPIARKVIDTYLGVQQAAPAPAPVDDGGEGALE
jgi:penicillin-binding protein 2